MPTTTDINLSKRLRDRQSQAQELLDDNARDEARQDQRLTRMPDVWWDAAHEVDPYNVHEVADQELSLAFASDDQLAEFISVWEELQGLGDAYSDSNFVYALCHQLRAMVDADALTLEINDDGVFLQLLHEDFHSGQLASASGAQFTALWACTRAVGCVIAAADPLD